MAKAEKKHPKPKKKSQEDTPFKLDMTGTLWGCGMNDNAELGLGDEVDRLLPTQVGNAKDWVKIFSTSHGMALKSDGSAWGWGANLSGQLGLGFSGNPVLNPTQLNNANYWVDVALSHGQVHTTLLKSNGGIWICGRNIYGQLGLGYANFQSVDTFNAVSTPSAEWVSGTTGGTHTAAIYSDGSLWTWGNNANGQLGLGNTTEQHAPVQVGAGSTWTATAAGSSYTLALQANGSLWASGKNTDGQLGTGNNSEQHSFVQVSGTWASVAAGDVHSIALKADGTLWAWGGNSTGQLGIGNYTSHNAPVQVGQDSTWIAIAAGEGHTLAIKSDGTLWAWGLNLYGQLGIGNNTIQTAPIQVGTDNTWTAISAGANHSLALKANGTVWAWGQNTDGQLGLGNNTNQTSPVQVSGTNWIAINAGRAHSIAYKADGTIWSWGNNGYGQLGLGNNTNQTSPQQVSQPAIVHMFAGPEGDHSGILKDTRRLVCMAGKNDHGQLGDNSILDKNTFNCINDCVIPGITIAVNPDDTICSGDTTTFTATISNGGPTPTYQWFKNNVHVGPNSSTYIVNPGGLNTGDVIKCVLTGSAACNVVPTDTSNLITMTVVNTVTPTITIAADLGDTICQEHLSTYTATITHGGTNPVYQWYENNNPVGTNSNTYVPMQISGNIIKCKLTSSEICATPQSVTSAPHTMLIVPVTTPQVTITANPGTTIVANTSVNFTANATNVTNPQYQWKKNGNNIVGATQQTYTSNTLQNGDVIKCRVRGLSICDTGYSNPLTITVFPVSVGEVTGSSVQLSIYPNPVKDVLQIDYSNLANAELQVSDITGRILIKQKLQHSLDVKGLVSGVYMLQVTDTETGIKLMRKVVRE